MDPHIAKRSSKRLPVQLSGGSVTGGRLFDSIELKRENTEITNASNNMKRVATAASTSPTTTALKTEAPSSCDGSPSPENGDAALSDSKPEDVNIMTVHNVLASGYLGQAKLDLDRICATFGNSYYNPVEFPTARVDVRGQCGSVYTISIFESGRIQSTGGCWPGEARRSMKKIAKKLKYKLGYSEIRFQKFEVQNILAVIDFGHNIRLQEFCNLYGNVDYEPERFPAARIRVPMAPKSPLTPLPLKSAPNVNAKRNAARIIHQPKGECVTVNVFSTGKATFTGGKSLDSIYKCLNEIRPYIRMSNI